MGGDGTRPHPFTPPIHISGYAPAISISIHFINSIITTKDIYILTTNHTVKKLRIASLVYGTEKVK